MTLPAQGARVVIEALRAGVPNRAAIRLLGSVETAIRDRFVPGLEAAWGPSPQPGMALAGGFGTGKSHLLGHLREEALRRKYVVSWVTVSKETPLSRLGLVFAAAMRGAVIPDTVDDAITVLLAEMERREGAVQNLKAWASSPEAGVAPVFAAVAHLLARNTPAELMHGIEAFLCGAKPPTTQLRQRLADLGVRGMFELGGSNAATLQLQRPRFMTQLIRAAGFRGLVRPVRRGGADRPLRPGAAGHGLRRVGALARSCPRAQRARSLRHLRHQRRLCRRGDQCPAG